MSEDYKTVLLKMASYCAYQERCEQEVLEKLRKLPLQLPPDQEANLLAELRTEGFLNQDRFAHAFAQGKFRQKQWGKHKIAFALRQKGITSTLLQNALDSIDAVAYEATLERLAAKKWESLPNTLAQHLRKQKTMAFLQQKGYGLNDIYTILDDLAK